MANMAIYHFSAQIIGRSDGRSSVAAAAYRSGEALTDERTGTECRYDRRRERIAHTEILAPAGSPAWATDRNSLWNAVERGERRKDAQLAREFEIALPVELTEQQNQDLVRDWVNEDGRARVRADTAEYMVLRAPKVAPMAMISATSPASTPMVAVRLPDWPEKKSRSRRASTLSCGSLVRRFSSASKLSVLASCSSSEE